MIWPVEQSSVSTMNGTGLKIGIVVTRYNLQKISAVFSQSYEALRQAGVAPEDIHVVSVPGSYDLSSVARSMLAHGSYNAIICLGTSTKGAPRYKVLVEDTKTQKSQSQSVALIEGVPVIFSEIGLENGQQPEGWTERHAEYAQTAIKIARILQVWPELSS